MTQRIEQTWEYDLTKAAPGKIYHTAVKFRDGSTGIIEAFNLDRGWEPVAPYENNDTLKDRGAEVYAFTEIVAPTYMNFK